MTTSIRSLMAQERGAAYHVQFPHAPGDWSPQIAREAASAEGLVLTEEHWEVVRALQEYFARHEPRERSMREVHDALDEHFHAHGGRKYLYRLLPAGPVAQGCRIAGLPATAIAVDRGFGSVM